MPNYKSVNVSDIEDTQLLPFDENRPRERKITKQKSVLMKIYKILGLIMFVFFCIATYDIIYWHNVCGVKNSINNMHNTSTIGMPLKITNNTFYNHISENNVSHNKSDTDNNIDIGNTNTNNLLASANTPVDNSDISQKLHCFIFLYGVTFYCYIILALLTVVMTWRFCGNDISEEGNCCYKFCSACSVMTCEILTAIVTIMFICMMIFRIVLFGLTVKEYTRCTSSCYDGNDLITFIPFCIETAINFVILLIGLCYGIHNCCVC